MNLETVRKRRCGNKGTGFQMARVGDVHVTNSWKGEGEPEVRNEKGINRSDSHDQYSVMGNCLGDLDTDMVFQEVTEASFRN